MPTYDYRCTACKHTFELFQSMKDPVKRKCPACGKNALERLIGTGAAVLFKGSGFYETDYRSKSYKDAAKKESGASSETGATGGAAPPDKGAEKPPAKTEPASKPEKAPKPAENSKPARSAKSSGE